MFKSKKLIKQKEVSHGFFNRNGGYSKGIYQSLNCGPGSNDKKVNIKKKNVGEKGKFLKEDLVVKISFYEEKPISVELPNQINCKIESTDVALKGQTVSSSYKPAILDNGAKIQVPPFIESGDEIVVDTRSIEYVKKI